jgi:photosystem II stability/assembly factor-like uncharacterized protein
MSNIPVGASFDIKQEPVKSPQRNPWLVMIEVLVSVSLVAGLFYVAFFVKLSSEVPLITPSPFGNRDNYFDMISPDPENKVLWAVGRGGRIIRTQDSGQHWDIQTVPVLSHLQSIAAWDEETAVVVGDRGVALLTEDGGNHWRQLTLPIRDFGEQLLKVITVGDKEAWLVGQMGTVMYSQDRGHSWSMRHEEQDIAFNGLTVTPSGTLWLVGEFGQIKKSTDQGMHWQEIESPTQTSLMAVAFADDNLGVAVGLSGTVVSTVDGGVNWQLVDVDLNSHLYTLAWTGERFAAVGNGGMILLGEQGSWRQIPLGNQVGWYTNITPINDGFYLSGSNITEFKNRTVRVFKDQ